ncbi:hypothetical protein FJZ31_28225 [Candidatus Poribacteria bacterium]|nr:hypothetical protein [Candidatus Poribacteria bacterium]
MRKIFFILTTLCFCALLVNVQSFAKDSSAITQKLVAKVKGAHNHPDYYTGKHGFMNDTDLTSDGQKLEKGLYLLSWLVLDPPYVGKGPAATFKNDDALSEIAGISEKDITKSPKNWPVAGQKLKGSSGIASGGSWWIPINFQDLIDAGQGGLFASGNQFDWLEWGGQGLNIFIEYLFCVVKWDKGGKVTLKAGSDDPETTWVNGKVLCEGLADRNWARDTDMGEFTATPGEWVAILGKVGENGGECGYTLRLEPPPDDHTLDIEGAQAVSLKNKLTATWGYIKAR